MLRYYQLINTSDEAMPLNTGWPPRVSSLFKFRRSQILSGPETENYLYTRLENLGTFRVIKLLQGKCPDPLRCSILQSSLQNQKPL
jgi:hypothetical protein